MSKDYKFTTGVDVGFRARGVWKIRFLSFWGQVTGFSSRWRMPPDPLDPPTIDGCLIKPRPLLLIKFLNFSHQIFNYKSCAKKIDNNLDRFELKFTNAITKWSWIDIIIRIAQPYITSHCLIWPDPLEGYDRDVTLEISLALVLVYSIYLGL